MRKKSITLKTPLEDLVFTVFDLETTGVRPGDGDQIVEIGLLHYGGGKILDTYRTLVRPSPHLLYVNPSAEVHRISRSDQEEAPAIREVIDKIVDFLRETVVVAHNVNFDMGFLQTTLKRLGRPRLDNWTVDTLYLSQKIWPVLDCHCLVCLHSSLKMKRRGTHRAMDDVYQTTELLERLIRHFPRKDKPTLAVLEPFRRDYTWKSGDIYRETVCGLNRALKFKSDVYIYSYRPGDCTFSAERARPIAIVPGDRVIVQRDDGGGYRDIPLFDILKIRPAAARKQHRHSCL